MRVRLSVAPVPVWVDAARLLGAAVFSRERLDANNERLALELDAPLAADVAARLRGLGLDGRALEVHTDPPLGRALVRAARLRDARARRATTPGFLRSGARATGEGRFSLTPEPLALAIGRLAAGARVLDACAGSGGNAIGFARAGCTVHALELEPARLDEARHNAALYGVAAQIRFQQGDARELVPRSVADVLFIDPPWGEHYDRRRSRRESFPLLDALLRQELRAYGEVWVKLPSSFEVESLGSVEPVRPSAWFGEAEGDRQRIKFVLLCAAGAAFQGAR